MNENNNRKCPKCFSEVKEEDIYCPNCGAYITGKTINKPSKKAIILLIISLINCVFFLPIAAKFFVLWFIFGGLSGNPGWVNILYIIIAYVVISIILLLYSIHRFLKEINFGLVAYWVFVIGSGLVALYMVIRVKYGI